MFFKKFISIKKMYKLKNKAENLDILKKIFQNNKTITIPSYFYFNLKNLKKK